MPLDQIENGSGRWDIALVCDLATNLLVCFVVEVKRIVIEHRVPTDTERLVDLKIETYARHSVYRIAVCGESSASALLRLHFSP